MEDRYTPPLDGREPSLFRKIAEAQAALPVIEPGETVRTEQYSYSYVTESQLLTKIRAELNSRNVAAFVSVESQGSEVLEVQKSGRNGPYTAYTDRAWVTIAVTFADGDSGETFTIHGQGRGNDAGDKAVYKAITSANRYVWWKTMLIPTDEDDVNKRASEELVKGQAAQASGQAAAAAPTRRSLPRKAQREQFANRLALLAKIAPTQKGEDGTETPRDWLQTVKDWTFRNSNGKAFDELSAEGYQHVLDAMERWIERLEQDVNDTFERVVDPADSDAALAESGAVDPEAEKIPL